MGATNTYDARTILERVLIPDLVLNKSELFLKDPEGSVKALFSDNRYPSVSNLTAIRDNLSLKKYIFDTKYNIIQINLPALHTDGQGSCERIYAIPDDGHIRLYLIEKNSYWFYRTDKFIASIDAVERGESGDRILHTVYDASENDKENELKFIIHAIDNRYKVSCKTESVTYNRHVDFMLKEKCQQRINYGPFTMKDIDAIC